MEGVPESRAACVSREILGPAVAEALFVLVLVETYEATVYCFYHGVFDSRTQSQVPRALVFKTLPAGGQKKVGMDEELGG